MIDKPEISAGNGGEPIEVGKIAEYIADMLEPLSHLAGETGMELLSMLIDFATREANNIKDNYELSKED
ncbi:MAG: hypothetical protein C0605_08910 [Hyphomicrobiales bacterium]|nr:MAG: hypothetical protein C0605_08910 [Hyphomicrobiales bacterium]